MFVQYSYYSTHLIFSETPMVTFEFSSKLIMFLHEGKYWILLWMIEEDFEFSIDLKTKKKKKKSN